MKTTKIALLSLGMALSVGAGVGAVYAITRNNASSSGTGSFDKVVNLYWGSESTSATLTNIDNLGVSTPEYRYLTVSPKSSASVSGNVSLSFTLATKSLTNGKTAVTKGLTVSVYKTTELATDATVTTAIDGVTAAPVLSGTTLTGSTSFAISTSTSAHETVAYYAISVVYDGTLLADTEQLAATLTISQSFGA